MLLEGSLQAPKGQWKQYCEHQNAGKRLQSDALS